MYSPNVRENRQDLPSDGVRILVLLDLEYYLHEFWEIPSNAQPRIVGNSQIRKLLDNLLVIQEAIGSLYSEGEE